MKAAIALYVDAMRVERVKLIVARDQKDLEIQLAQKNGRLLNWVDIDTSATSINDEATSFRFLCLITALANPHSDDRKPLVLNMFAEVEKMMNLVLQLGQEAKAHVHDKSHSD